MKKEKLISKEDPFVQGLVKRLPEDLQDSFTDDQLAALKLIFARQSWREHPIDFRNSIGMLNWRYYFVFIAGRDFRTSRVIDRPIMKKIEAVFLTVMIIFMGLFGILVAYLIKSALGIDLIPNFSFGVWGWFQSTFLN